MTKKKSIAYNCISLLLISIAYWLCNYYPKHIVEFGAYGFSVIGTFFNAIVILLYCFLLTIFFCKSKTLFSENIFGSDLPITATFCIKKLFLSASVFLLCDILRSVTQPFLAEWSYIFIDVLTVVTWLTIYSILTFKSDSLYKKRPYAISALSIIIVLLAIIVLFDIHLIDKASILLKKFIGGAGDQYTLTNIDFLHGILALIFDFFVGCTLIIFHTISTTAENCRRDKEEVWDKRKNVYKTMARFVVLFIMMGLIVVLKFLIAPIQSFAGYSVEGEKSTFYVAMEKFDIDTECITVYRFVNRGVKQPVYCATNVVIRYDNIVTAEFTVDRVEKATIVESEGNHIVIEDNFAEYYIDDTKVYVFANDAISFVENGKPKTIMFSDINTKHKESTILTNLCKKLISDGNISVFENSYKYLSKYDKEFIQPYINRYSVGDFNQQERTFLDKYQYNESYIINLVK